MSPRMKLTNKAIVLFSCCCIFSRWGRTYILLERLSNILLDTKTTSYPRFYAFALFNMRNFSFARKRSDLTRLYKKFQGKLRNVLGNPGFFPEICGFTANHAQTANCKLQIDFEITFHMI